MKSEDFLGEKYLLKLHKLDTDVTHACTDVAVIQDGVVFRHHLQGEEKEDLTRPEYGVGFSQLPISLYKRTDDFISFVAEIEGDIPRKEPS